ATRFAVPQSSRGGRVPMVFTQVTCRCGNKCRTRCWQLDGCRPQSSAKTNRGGLLAGGSAIPVLCMLTCPLRFLPPREAPVRRGEPVTVGLPWPRGAVTDDRQFRLIGPV